MRFLIATVAISMLGMALTGSLDTAGRAADDNEPAPTIKDVMKKAHESGLLKKVLKGSASDVEKGNLLTLYEALGRNEPPQGDAAAWKARCDAIVEAAQGVVDGKEGSAASLETATNCAECHKEHKGS